MLQRCNGDCITWPFYRCKILAVALTERYRPASPIAEASWLDAKAGRPPVCLSQVERQASAGVPGASSSFPLQLPTKVGAGAPAPWRVCSSLVWGHELRRTCRCAKAARHNRPLRTGVYQQHGHARRWRAVSRIEWGDGMRATRMCAWRRRRGANTWRGVRAVDLRNSSGGRGRACVDIDFLACHAAGRSYWSTATI
eukprot:355589-Chlamydomonas_euryale.AAC.11